VYQDAGNRVRGGYCTLNRKKAAFPVGANSKQMLPSTTDTDSGFTVRGAKVAKSLKLPARSPNLNAFVERFVRTIKSECLDRMILIGEPSLRRAVDQFAEHYHRELNHQGLERDWRITSLNPSSDRREKVV
jgi:hypothetical protein